MYVHTYTHTHQLSVLFVQIIGRGVYPIEHYTCNHHTLLLDPCGAASTTSQMYIILM